MTPDSRALILGAAALTAAGLLIGAASPATAADAEDAAGTVRIVAATDDVAADARSRVGAMSLREKAASVVMGHVPTTDAEELREYMATNELGGFLLMGANIPDREAALRRLTAALVVDDAVVPLIAIDQEGGDVSRLPWDDFPAAPTLKSRPADQTRDAFAARGGLVMRAGANVNFGVVADETDDADMFIYRRALGATPDAAAARVEAAVHGEAGSATSTLKHFPGHGAAPGDSHGMIPTTSMSRGEWAQSAALPFDAGIEAGADLLMYGHLRYTAVDRAPASLSARWHEIARTDLGFAGVSITDDLGMLQATGQKRYADPVANAVRALAAGNDMVLTVMLSTPATAPEVVDGIIGAVERGDLPGERLDEAAERVMTLRLSLSADGPGMLPCAACDAAG